MDRPDLCATGLAALCVLAAGCAETAGRDATPAAPGRPSLFRDVTTACGVAFDHTAGVDGSYFMPEIMGAGAALLDYDGDGDLDLYLVNGARHGDVPDSGPPPVNRLYRREADGTYTDATERSGLGDPGFGMGVAVGDYDNDGDPDIYVANYGPDRLYRNDGDGTFTDVSVPSGIASAQGRGLGVVCEDLDGDMLIDVYVANDGEANFLWINRGDGTFHESGVMAGAAISSDAGHDEYCGPLASPPTPDVLYRNDGDGTFTDMSVPSGIASAQGRGLGVICEDLDGDTLIDIYVANDGEANFLWINRGDGTFLESAVMAGAAISRSGSPEASMGVAAGDVDGDGDLDLFMSHLVRETNTLYRNDGAGNFDDVTAAAGLAAASLRYTGFGTVFLDVEHDGDLDVAVVNGRVTANTAVAATDDTSLLAPYAEPNLLFLNDGAGRFSDASDTAADLCRAIEVSRGLVAGDLDDDGDLDLVMTNCEGPARVLHNETPKQGHWLIVRALENVGPRDAYGASVTVVAGERRFRRSVNPCSSYASSNDPRAHFGLGDAERYDAVEVRWADGVTERFDGGPADRVITLVRTAPASAPG
jgi:hypothetical protein